MLPGCTAGSAEGSMTILVVDDNELVRYILWEVLRELDYEAIGVADGRAALDYLHSTSERPRLIILDPMVPQMDGWTFCAALRRDSNLAAIPIVITSACQDLADETARLGAVAYLTKPLDYDRLAAIVQHYAGPGQRELGG